MTQSPSLLPLALDERGHCYDAKEMLELCRMLVRAQIREERINSIEELHGIERHISDALSAVPASQAVAVKPLEWRFFDVKHDHGNGVWDANGPWSTFTICDCEGWDATGERYYVPHLSKTYPTLDEAKAAAQADFERRIRSALIAQDIVELRILFADDGGPSNLRFVEIETIDGKSVNAGTWMKKGQYDVLALSVHKSDLRSSAAPSPQGRERPTQPFEQGALNKAGLLAAPHGTEEGR